MNLRRIDLNLLVIFDALIEERNVTRAAQRVALSQPALSNALSRLRHFLKDDLFIRRPEGMIPTPRALELAPQIRAALVAIETSLERQDFDPGTSTRTFTLQTNDYLASTLLPRLMQRLAKEAPGINIRVIPPNQQMVELLDSSLIDFALGSFRELPPRLAVEVIDDFQYSCMMNAGHPLARGKLDLKRYAAAKHLLITPRGDPVGFVDEALAASGLRRRIALTVNHFSVVPAIIAETDLIVTLPSRIAERDAALYGLKLRPSPVQSSSIFSHIRLVWHRQLGAHPAFHWFRELILALMDGR